MQPEKKSQKKVDRIKRKAASIRSSLRKYGITGMTTTEIAHILEIGVDCPYCREPIQTKLVSVDHIQPRSKGGADNVDNIQFTCKSCNLAKGNLTDEQFKALMAFLATDPDMRKNVLARLKIGGARRHGRWEL